MGARSPVGAAGRRADHLDQLRARYSDSWFTLADVDAAVQAGYLKQPPAAGPPGEGSAIRQVDSGGPAAD
jgi:hypothetical protein